MNQQPKAFPAPNQPPLPPGWQLFLDQFGRPFYWNHYSKESSWTAPPMNPNGNPNAQKPNPNPQYSVPSTPTANYPVQGQPPYPQSQPYPAQPYTQPKPQPVQQSPPQQPTGPFPPGWEQAKDPQGRIYYINHQTKSTQWEDPRLTQKPAQPQTAPNPQYQAQNSNYSSYLNAPVYAQNVPQQAPVSQPPMTQPTVYPAQPQPQPQPQQYGYPQYQQNPGYAQPQVAPAPVFGQPQQFPANQPILLCASKPQWDTNKEGPKCTRCGTEFSFFKRRHHCRCCSREFCDEHTTKRANVPQFGLSTPQRVCDHCAKHLAKNETVCVEKLVPYLVSGAQNMEKAIRELHELVAKQRKEGIHEDLLLVNILPSVLDLVKIPNNSTQNTTHMTSELRKDLLEVLEIGSEDATVLKTLADLKAVDCLVGILLNSTIETTPEMKIFLVKTLSRLSKLDECKNSIRTLNGIKPLLDFIGGSPNETLVLESAVAIHTLVTNNDENRGLVGQQVAVLIIHLSSPSPALAAAILGTIEQVSLKEANRSALHDIGAIQALFSLLHDKQSPVDRDSNLQIQVWNTISELSKSDESCKTIASTPNGISTIFAFVTSTVAQIQQHSLATLLNILKHADIEKSMNEEIKYIDGAMKNLVKLIHTDKIDIQKLAIEILMRFTSDPNKTFIRECGAIEALVKTVSVQNDNLVIALEALSKIVASNKENSLMLLNIGGLALLLDLIASPKPEVQSYAMLCIDQMSSCDQVVESLLSLGESPIKQLCGILGVDNVATANSALQLLGTICVNDQSRNFIDVHGGIKGAVILLEKKQDNINLQRNSLRLIGRLSASDKLDDKIRDSMSTNGAVLPVVSALSSTDVPMQQHSSFALKHICRSYSNREQILNFGALQPITSLMATNSTLQDMESRVRVSEVLAAFSSDERARPIMKEAKALPSFIELLFSDNESLQINGVMALSNFALDESNIPEIHKLGGVMGLIPLLSASKPTLQESTVLAIGNLARNQASRDEMVSAGVLDPILALIPKAESLQAKAVWALSVLSLNAELANQIQQSKLGLQPLVDLLLHTKDFNLSQQLIFVIMQLSGRNATNWQTFVLLGGAKALLTLAVSVNTEAQKRACEELFAMSTSQEMKSHIIEADGVKSILSTLNSQDPMIQETALGILANISTEESSWEHLVPSLSVINPFLSPKKIESQIFASTILANISRAEINWKYIVDTGAIPKLNEMLFSGNDHLCILGATAISHMSVATPIAELIHQHGGVLGLITLLSNKNENLQEIVTSALGNLSRSSNLCRETIINNDGLEPIVPLLSSKNEKLQKNSLFIVGMLSSNEKFCQSIEALGGLPPLIHLLEHSPNEEIQDQVLATFVNITANGNKNRFAVLQAGALPLLIGLLSLPFSTTGIIDKTLEVLANLSVENQNKKVIRELNGLPTILSFLEKSETQTLSVVRALANLTIDSANRKMLADLGVADKLHQLVRSNSKIVSSFALNAVDDLVSLKSCKVNLVNSGLIATLVELLVKGDPSVQQRILQSVGKLVNDDMSADMFLQAKGIEILCKLLSSSNEIVQFYSLNLMNSLMLDDGCRVNVMGILDRKVLNSLCTSTNGILQESAFRLKSKLE